MQFTGHSLPVHQSMSVPWEFFTSSHFISQFPPTRFPLITAIRMCHFLPVHHSEWHFWSGRRSKYHSDISTQKGNHLKVENKFTHLRSSVSSTENDINTRLTKGLTAINRLTDKIKHSCFQAAVVSILLYGCTTRTLTKRMEKKTAITQECYVQY